MTAPSNNTDKPIVHPPHAAVDVGQDELELARQLCAADIGYRLADDPLHPSRTPAEWDEYWAGLDKINRQARRDEERRRRKLIARDIAQIEQTTGKTVTGITVAPGGRRTYTVGGPSSSEAPSTADDELERWRRKHAR